MTMHNVRLVLVDGDEGSFEVDDNGTSPQSTFETKGGKTYPLPETGSKTAYACVRIVVMRFCHDPGLGVPPVREVYADRELLVEMFVLDDLFARDRLVEPQEQPRRADGSTEIKWSRLRLRGSGILSVAFFTPEGTPVLPSDCWPERLR